MKSRNLLGYFMVVTMALTIVLTTIGCGHKPIRTLYQPEVSNMPANWEEALNKGQKVQFETLLTGYVTVPRSGMLNLDRPQAEKYEKSAEGKHQTMEVEVMAHWIRHPTKGDYLIDSGLDSSFQARPQGNTKGLLASYFIKNSRQAKGQNIEALLATRDVKLKGVFLTHLHGDHSAGLTELPKNIDIYVGKGETIDYYPGIYTSNHFDGIQQIKELDFDSAPLLAPLGSVIDIFSDGSLWAIQTPGHSRAHVSYLVNSQHGWVLLTGDASHTRWGFENSVEPGWVYDRKLAKQSLAKLKRFAQQHPEIEVIYGHQH